MKHSQTSDVAKDIEDYYIVPVLEDTESKPFASLTVCLFHDTESSPCAMSYKS